MLPLADVLFSIEKYKAMKQRNSYPILGHASCHSQEEWHLDSSMLRSMSRIMRPVYVCHGKHVVHVKEASYLRDCLLNLNMAIIVLIRLATLQPGSLCSIVP